ncbi:hypothetical protein LF41_154 [Lysobacter dokdonensis DS-58]|uniref:PilZ domain-containing protein n=2 Tax=Noviluteimonas TaxID=3382693 RepID=A0A0A2WK15_9GAMM|nr:hypothetical protein LF41_154 [Lysobacter dokdonensis DS-58]
MAPTAQDDIRRSRVHVDGEALIRGPEGDFRAPLRDLSITGLHMLRPPGFTLRVGQAVEVEVRCGPPEAGIEFLLMARIARTDSDTVGLRFAPMPDRCARTMERVLTQFGTLYTGATDERRGRR